MALKVVRLPKVHIDDHRQCGHRKRMLSIHQNPASMLWTKHDEEVTCPVCIRNLHLFATRTVSHSRTDKHWISRPLSVHFRRMCVKSARNKWAGNGRVTEDPKLVTCGKCKQHKAYQIAAGVVPKYRGKKVRKTRACHLCGTVGHDKRTCAKMKQPQTQPTPIPTMIEAARETASLWSRLGQAWTTLRKKA